MTQSATGAVVGYARTSTVEQVAGLAGQVAELASAGCTKIFEEQSSGVDASRPRLREALAYLREGDTFVVAKPDRLARSTTDLLRTVEGLTERGVRVRILSMDVDTATATGKLLLTLMAGIAAFERELMLERQRCGIAAAKAAGKYRGRQPTAQAQTQSVLSMRANGRCVADIVRECGISRASVYRIFAQHAS